MATQNRTYQRGVVRLHWISAVLIIFLLGIGLWMVELDLASEGRRQATRAHVIGGVACLVVTVLRLVSRARSTPPPPLEMSQIHQLGVRAVHLLQYVSLVGLLLSGVGLALSAGLSDVVLGAAAVPDMSELVPRAPHGLLAKVFIGLLVAHVVGVALTQLQGGGTFQRMGLPQRSSEDGA